jgi:drug/metabolite transporter (DMT)-like permease
MNAQPGERSITAVAVGRERRAGRLDRLPHSRLLANLSALVASIIFGGATVATRAAVREVAPFTLGFLRFAIGGLVLMAVLALWRRSVPLWSPREYALVAVLGAALFGLFPLLFNSGLRLTEASRGAVLLATIPLASLLLARRLRSEKLAPRQVAGVCCTFLGVLLIFGEAGTSKTLALPALGDAMLLVCAGLAAVYGVFGGRLVRSRGPLAVTACAMLFGSLVQLPAAGLEIGRNGLPHFGPESLRLLIFLALAGGAAGYFLWTAALTRLAATEVAVYINMNPLVAAVLAALLLGERLTAFYLVALVGVLGGVLLVNWPAGRR